MKKLRIVAFVVLICCFMTIPTFASDASVDSTVVNDVNESLGCIEQSKADLGLSDVDFSSLAIGNEVFFYEHVPTGFNMLRSAYPLFSGGEIVALATEIASGRYQITTVLAEKIRNLELDSVAIVYALDGCYAYDGLNFHLLIEDFFPESGRLRITGGETAALAVTDLSKYVDLSYSSSTKNTRMNSYASCPVAFIPQAPYSNLCWAATTACITNYINGTSFSAVDVAQSYFGVGVDIDYGLNPAYVAIHMNDVYSLGYTYKYQVPNIGVIHTNLSYGCPLYGAFSWATEDESGTHAVTIYTVDLYGMYATVMDPEYGAITATYSNGTLSYFREDNSLTLTLYAAICKYWS